VIFSFLSITLLAQEPLLFDKLNTRVDNLGYWKAAAEHGLTMPNPQRSAPPAIYTGSEIRAVSVITEDSPDVLLISGNTSQSENSVFVNPNDDNNPLNSNNSTNQPSGNITFYGAYYLYSFDGAKPGAALSWEPVYPIPATRLLPSAQMDVTMLALSITHTECLSLIQTTRVQRGSL